MHTRLGLATRMGSPDPLPSFHTRPRTGSQTHPLKESPGLHEERSYGASPCQVITGTISPPFPKVTEGYVLGNHELRKRTTNLSNTPGYRFKVDPDPAPEATSGFLIE